MTVTPSYSPPTPEQLAELNAAQSRYRLIRRAVVLSKWDAILLLCLAGLTFLGGFWDASGFIVGVVLGAIAAVELILSRALEQGNFRAPKRLAANQCLLGGAVIVYSIFKLIYPTPLSDEVLSAAGDLKSLGVDVKQLSEQLNEVVYATLIAATLCVQGSMALFYLRRERMLRDDLNETPEWIRQMRSAGLLK